MKQLKLQCRHSFRMLIALGCARAHTLGSCRPSCTPRYTLLCDGLCACLSGELCCLGMAPGLERLDRGTRPQVGFNGCRGACSHRLRQRANQLRPRLTAVSLARLGRPLQSGREGIGSGNNGTHPRCKEPRQWRRISRKGWHGRLWIGRWPRRCSWHGLVFTHRVKRSSGFWRGSIMAVGRPS